MSYILREKDQRCFWYCIYQKGIIAKFDGTEDPKKATVFESREEAEKIANHKKIRNQYIVIEKPETKTVFVPFYRGWLHDISPNLMNLVGEVNIVDTNDNDFLIEEKTKLYAISKDTENFKLFDTYKKALKEALAITEYHQNGCKGRLDELARIYMKIRTMLEKDKKSDTKTKKTISTKGEKNGKKGKN